MAWQDEGLFPSGAKYIVNPGVDRTKPGLYQWTIDGKDSYIGKYTHSRRPEREYALNVKRLLAGKPYRKGRNNDEGFREIHRALAEAVRDGRRIELRLLENADPAMLVQREQELIRLHGTLNRTGRQQRAPGAG